MRSSGAVRADSISTGIRDCRRSRRRTSKPSSLGIMTSRITTSGRVEKTVSSPAALSLAVDTR
jgi:hypothetical protein